MENSLFQKITQKMSFSMQMQQSLQVLQMPLAELSLWVEEQVMLNPLFDLDYTTKPPLFSYTLAEDPPVVPSFFSYLLMQASSTFSKRKHLEIATWIIGNLNEQGFYVLSKEELPPTFAEDDFLFCLEAIQQFDPIGVGARSMQEALLVQLKAKNKETSLAYTLIEIHLSELISGKLSLIAKKLHISKKSIEKAVQDDISPLDPFPGYRFGKQPIYCHVDDVIIEENFAVKIPTISFPRKKIEFSTLTIEEKKQMGAYESSANWVLRTLHKRTETLEKIARYVAEKQRAFLQGESNSLAPLTISDVSEELGLHESTIARAVANKMLSYPLGRMPIKQLFSKKLKGATSTDEAMRLLEKLIYEENKKSPLSDRELLEKMQNHGIECGRRTITKYRQLLLIPPKNKRKKTL